MRDFRHCVFVGLITVFLLSGCTPLRTNRPSVVLLLLESLGENDFICTDIRSLDHLEELKAQCDNFTRFTHAYTPSPLSQAAVSSLMTGSEIESHGVVHNGAVAIPASMETLAEKAVQKGLRTSFFSGGAPIFNKFGLHQGFEIFDHSYTSKPKSYFRPILETMRASLKWLDQQAESDPVFITLYHPDLLHSEKKTTTDEGRERARNRQAQLHEVYESINEFIVDLKARKRWRNTFFAIVGVNGPVAFHGKKKNEIDNVTSQRTHISLHIKPHRVLKEHLKKIHNDMLSLTDLGKFLNEFIFSNVKAQAVEDWLDQREKKTVSIRSDWEVWRSGEGLPARGLRVDQYLFSFSPFLQVYNSFVDASEIEPISYLDSQSVARQYKIDRYLSEDHLNPCFLKIYRSGTEDRKGDFPCSELFISNKSRMQSLNEFLRLHWQALGSDETFSETLWEVLGEKKGKKTNILMGWLSDYYLRSGNWKKLLKVSKLKKDQFLEIVALKNLKEKVKARNKGCWLYFSDTKLSLDNFYRQCEDSSLRKIAEGLSLLKLKKKPLKSFWSEVRALKNIRTVKRLNLDMFLINDVDEAFHFEPSLSELYFYLPENKAFQKLIEINET